MEYSSQNGPNQGLPKIKKEVEEPKKIEQVVSGEVIRRKKSMGKRFSEYFIGGDAKTAARYVFFDVFIPSAKDTIADMMSMGVEKMLFGEVRSTSRRGIVRPGLQNAYTNYTQYSSKGSPRRRDESRGPSRRARAAFDFDEIILPTRFEAEQVIDKLFDLTQRYQQASVRDLYELVGVESNFTDEKYGWTDLRGADINRVKNGYLLELPRPEPLD